MRSLPLCLLLALSAHTASARTLGSLQFEPCTLGSKAMPTTVEAQCTTLRVPENRAQPDGRQIELALAWVPASTPETAAEPLFMLAGGPGQAARDAFPGIASAFAHVLKTRHVILLDQRGTGGSAPLFCRDAEGRAAMAEEGADDAASQARFAASCLAALEADPRHYTTGAAVADLDAVRAALQAPRIDLIGISYGTRVAQAYARTHPQHTRALVLDAVVPNELILGSEHARNLEAALDLHFEQCRKNDLCRERFGDTRVTLDALLATARSAPQRVSYRDPLSGELREDEFGVGALAAVVRLFAYAPQTAALLPLALAEAAAGRPQDLMAQARMLEGMLDEEIAHGMQLSVLCSEDAAGLALDPADAQTTMGNALIEMTQAQCGVWPKGEVTADFHAPLVSDVPALLLSGEFDPVTPPRYGEQVLKGLSNGRHLVLRGQGHNVVQQGCMPRLLAEFLKSADAKALDTECLDDLRYVPPFAGYYGWEP